MVTNMLKDFESIIGAVKIKALKNFPFFGVFILDTPVKVTDSVPTAATNGKIIMINKQFIEKVYNENGLEAVMGVFVHEVLHMVLMHVFRMQNRDRMRWNFATDAEVNCNILDKMHIPLPDGVVRIDDVDGKVAEEIYKMFPEPPQFEMMDSHEFWGMAEDNNDSDGDGNSDSESSGDEDKEGKGKSGKGKDKKSSKKDGDKNEQSGGKDQKDKKGGKFRKMTAAEVKTAERDMQKKIVTAYNVSKNRGDLPDSIKRLVEELTSPQYDWRAILAQFIQPTNDDYSFSPPDRRFSEYEFNLPSLSDESLNNIVIAVDTSGSIDINMLTRFVSEAIGILHCYPSVKAHFGVCDADVHEWVEVDTTTSAEKILNSLAGGGGTDFRPVFKKAEADFTKPSAMIFCTDTDGYFPEKTPDYPVLWVIPKEYKERATVPFGLKVFVNTE